MPTTCEAHQGIYCRIGKSYPQFIRAVIQVRILIRIKCFVSYIIYDRTLTDLYDVLKNIGQQPHLKQMLWRDGISILVSRVYEVLDAASFNVGNRLCCKVPKYNNSLLNFEAVAGLEEARSLDVDAFHDMIRTAQDDQILKVLKSFAVSRYSIMKHIPIRFLGCQVPSFRKPLLHFIRYSCCKILLFLIVS
jgi:hypothetical protein